MSACASPNLGQEVAVADMAENQLMAHMAGRLLLEQRERGGAGLEVTDGDVVEIDFWLPDLIGAGGHVHRSYVESEGDIGLCIRLSVGAGSGEHERQGQERQGSDKIALHKILPGAPRSGTQTGSQTLSTFAGSLC